MINSKTSMQLIFKREILTFGMALGFDLNAFISQTVPIKRQVSKMQVPLIVLKLHSSFT